MTSGEIFVFDKNDQDYQQWAEANPSAYVINTTRTISPQYLTVHRTTCRLVRQYNNMAQPGGYTERQYIKVCSRHLEALREWATMHGGPKGAGFTKRCSFCMKMRT
jgi:hypothetical protein